VWETIKNYIVEILTFGGLAILTAILATIRSVMANKRPPAILRFNEANMHIHQLLTETRVRLNADRVFVVQFRNGAKFDIDAPIFRIYMTHEVVGRGIAPVTLDWSGVPASQVYEIMATLWARDGKRNGKLPCDDCHAQAGCIKHPATTVTRWLDIPALDEGTLKSMLVQQGTYHLMVAPLTDGKDIVGYVGADFRDAGYVPVAKSCDYLVHAASNSVFELKRAIHDTRRSLLGRFWHHLWQSLIARRSGTDD